MARFPARPVIAARGWLPAKRAQGKNRSVLEAGQGGIGCTAADTCVAPPLCLARCRKVNLDVRDNLKKGFKV